MLLIHASSLASCLRKSVMKCCVRLASSDYEDQTFFLMDARRFINLLHICIEALVLEAILVIDYHWGLCLGERVEHQRVLKSNTCSPTS